LFLVPIVLLKIPANFWVNHPSLNFVKQFIKIAGTFYFCEKKRIMKWLSFFIVLFFVLILSNQKLYQSNSLTNETNTEWSIDNASNQFQTITLFYSNDESRFSYPIHPSSNKEIENNNIDHIIITDPNDITYFLPKPWHKQHDAA